MKKHLLYIISVFILAAAAINFAVAFYINYSDSINVSANPPEFSALTASSLYGGSANNFDIVTSSRVEAEEDIIHKSEHQLNRYNIARFIKELKYGTDLNSYALSQHLDGVGIPYEYINIITDDITCDDIFQMVAMSAVYTGYDVDNITHFENYARLLWASTHYITVNQNSYPATVLIDNTSLLADFYNDIITEYNNNNFVSLYLSPTAENYYELDPANDFTWTDEKISETESLKSMSYFQLINYLLKKNNETVLYSPLPLFNQGSGTWCNVQFGGGTIRSDGCCPCSISMVISYFKNERITPDVIAAMYDTNEYRSITSGSFGINMCRKAAADYGLNVETGNGALSAEQIEAYLKQGCKIVMSVKGYDEASGSGGDYSSGFHYITLAGITSDGYVIVNNPGYATDITYDSSAKVAANQSGKCYAIFSSGN